MKRITVELDDALLRQAKRVALERNTTLRELIATGLRRELAAAPTRAGGIDWVTASGAWPQGLDVSSRAAMWAWLAGSSNDGATR